MVKYKFDIDNFINDYNNNMAMKDMAKKYGYSYETALFPIIKQLGLPPRLNKWTKEKIELLKMHYPNSDWDYLLDILSPFKKEDIIAKAYKLKIKRECYGYSDADELFLKNNYESMTITELCDKLNKTAPSIMTKASKMGLIKMEKWSEEDIQKLIKLYPYYTNEELTNFFPNRTPTGISSMATMKLNLHKDEKHLSDKYYKIEKERMLKELIEFANELGRTPTTEEVQNNKNLSGSSSYHRYFGSYKDACIEAGLEVNANIFGKSFHLVSKNGDVCLSKKEKEITDLLIDNNIFYKKEVLYKDIICIENLTSIRCDWLINDEIIVEYFGMSEKEYYKQRMDNKIKLCEDYGLRLISLERKDMRSNYKGLINKFKKYGIDLVV